MHQFSGHKFNSLLRDIINTTVSSTVGKAFGFLTPFFIAAWFGISPKTDAFFFSYGLIIFLATIVSPVLEQVVVPFIVEARTKSADIGTLVSRLMSLSFLGLVLIALPFMFVAKPLISVLTRFDSNLTDLTFRLLLQSLPLVILLAWTSMLVGALNAYKVFSVPALSPVIRSAVTIVFIFLEKDTLGIYAVAWGYVIGELSRLLLLMVMIKRLKLFKLKLSFGWDLSVKDFLRKASYSILGMSVLAFNPLIDKTMATWLEAGSISILQYSERLYSIPATLLLAGLLTVITPHFSDRLYCGGKNELHVLTNKVARKILPISLIISLALFASARLVVILAYKHGDFPTHLVATVTTLYLLYLFGFVPYVIGQVFVRALLALKATKELMIVAGIKTFLNFFLNLLFMYFFGLKGIVISTSVTSFLILVVVHRYYKACLAGVSGSRVERRIKVAADVK